MEKQNVFQRLYTPSTFRNSQNMFQTQKGMIGDA